MDETKQRGETVTVTFRLTRDEYARWRQIVARLKSRETLGKVTAKSALVKGMQLTEKWLTELERPR